MPTLKLNRRSLSAIPPVDKATTFYDSDLKGFGLKVLPPSERNAAGARSWIVEYRPGAGGRTVSKKRVVLGSVDTISPEQARERAKTMLATIRLGGDPGADRREARTAKRIDELVPLYKAATNMKRKPRTVELYDGLWTNHLLPRFGTAVARNMRRDDVDRMHQSVGLQHPSTANRLVILLGHFFAWAQDKGHVPEGHNPARKIEKFRESGRERYLKADELSRLGDAIRLATTKGVPWAPVDTQNPKAKHAPKLADNRLTKIDGSAAGALRLLIFTGARLREILHLKWAEVDIHRGILSLGDSKTGRKTIVLGSPALVVLTELHEAAMLDAKKVNDEAIRPLSDYVFPSSADMKRPKSDLKRPWALIQRAASLEGVRLHDLRHSFASVGAGASMGLPIIGALLGHANVKTTQRYAHLDADPLRRASDLIGLSIATAMGEK